MAGGQVQQSQNPQILIKEIKDQYLRRNFQNLSDYFSTQNQLLGFKFFDQTFTGAQENFKLAHGLDLIPQDVLITQVTGKGRVTFNYGKFDSTNIDISVDDACRVRFFVGTYWQQKNPATQEQDDSWTVGSLSSASQGAGGDLSFPYVELTTDNASGRGYQVKTTDSYMVFKNTASAVTTIPTPKFYGAVLPLASDAKGKFFTFQKQDLTQTITCSVQTQPGSNDYISAPGCTSIQLGHSFEKYTLFSNGTYYVLYQGFSFQNAISQAYTPPTNTTWHYAINNFLTLQPGVYLIFANANFGGGASPVYSVCEWTFATANGDNTVTQPASIGNTTLTGVTTYMMPTITNSPIRADFFNGFGTYVWVVTKPVTAYMVTFATATTIANASIQTSWGALRVA